MVPRRRPFSWLGHLVVRRRRSVLLASAVLVVVAALLGGGVIDRLAGSGFDDPDSDSVAARAVLDERFDTGFADVAFLVTVLDTDDSAAVVDREEVRRAGLALTDELAAIEGTDDVVSYWTADSPDALRSADGTRALVLMRLPGPTTDEAREALSIRLVEDYRLTQRGPLEVRIGGRDAAFEQIGIHAENDLATAELIAIPLTLLLLVVVFRSVFAAALPVVVGITSVVGALFVLFLVTLVADVSIFALNLVTALGLGLAIDYSLLIVSRYREERVEGRSVEDAVVVTVQTAGRTVAFSGLTVAVSLSALLIFPLYFLRSFAYAGIGVIGFALLVSVVALPAALALLGDRIEWGTFGRRRRPYGRVTGWRRAADTVVDHPWRYLILGVVGLTAAAIPFLGVEWGESDHRSLPANDPVRRTIEIMNDEFATAEANAFPVVALGGVDPGSLTTHALTLSQLPGVDRVDTATGRFTNGAAIVPGTTEAAQRFRRDDAAWFNVVPSFEPISAEAEALVEELRRMPTPFERTLVGGGTASLIDTKNAIFDLVPLAAGLIIGATYVLLFLMFGSLLVPLKAIVLNLLSLGATFGLMVVVFQEGVGADFLGITATGFTDTSTPILIFGIAFGLSMDYEVFLLSRIKEDYERQGHNDDAIVEGIQRTGPLITAAALLLTITFLAFATSGLSFVKLFGLGLATAVLVDAFVVRVTVVPALMTLAGRANWWAPAPLRRLHRRWGWSEFDTTVVDLRDPDPDPAESAESVAPEGSAESAESTVDLRGGRESEVGRSATSDTPIP